MPELRVRHSEIVQCAGDLFGEAEHAPMLERGVVMAHRVRNLPANARHHSQILGRSRRKLGVCRGQRQRTGLQKEMLRVVEIALLPVDRRLRIDGVSGAGDITTPVSYTHLTLPTSDLV